MKLLSKQEVKSSLAKQNEELLETNLRLRKSIKEATSVMRNVKQDYTEDRAKKLQEFDKFCAELNEKKSKLLGEMNTLEKAIADKKDLYYGLVAKQDALEEKMYRAEERSAKLDLREGFVKQLEERQYAVRI